MAEKPEEVRSGEEPKKPEKDSQKCPHNYWVYDYDPVAKKWNKKCQDCDSIIVSYTNSNG